MGRLRVLLALVAVVWPVLVACSAGEMRASAVVSVVTSTPAQSAVTPPEPDVATPEPVTPPLTPASPMPQSVATSTPASVSTTEASKAATRKPPATAGAPSEPRNGRIMFGYYVPYDPTSWASLEAQADKIDYVAAQWVWIDACGNLSSQDDLTLLRFARAKGIRVLPSLLTDSGWMNHRLLTDEPTTARAIQNLVDYVVDVGYDGLDLDLEGVNATDRAVYTAFVARLSAALHKKGKLLTAALPAKASDVTTGWAGAFEYAALAPHLDLAVIMTYAYTTSSTPPGSTAPHDWVDRVISYVTTQMPPQKVLPGIAFYGYDWNVTTGGKARALRYPQAAALSDKYGVPITLDTTSRSATFTYTARAGDVPPPDPKLPALDHEIKTRSRPPCPVATATPSPAPTPRPSPTPPPVQQHVVWLEDAKSVLQRVNLAEKHRTGGIATWRLGQEDSGVWAVIREYRQGR